MPFSESQLTLQELREIQQAKCSTGRLTDARFDETHEAFETSSNQQELILHWLTHFTRKQFEDLSRIRMLSAGCGSGILDIPLMQAIAGGFAHVDYTAFDPNATACERFRNAFDLLEHPHVDLEVLETTVEKIREGKPVIDQKFDMVQAVHCLYYFDDPRLDVSCLSQMLEPGGQMVIVQAPKAELNQLADCFWQGHFQESIWYSADLENFLEEEDCSFHQHRIEAFVDITACFEDGNPLGKDVLDFLLQTPSAELTPKVKALTLEFLDQISIHDNGKILAPHPADVFVIGQS
jgi:SAM-dependent methyltransferase